MIRIGLFALLFNGSLYSNKPTRTIKQMSYRALHKLNLKKNSDDSHKIIQKKRSLATSLTPILETTEPEYRELLEKNFAGIRLKISTIEENDYTVINDALTAILRTKIKGKNKHVYILTSKEREYLHTLLALENSKKDYSIYNIIKYTIYSSCTDSENTLMKNVTRPCPYPKKSSPKVQEIYLLVHQLAGFTIQQYFQDVLNGEKPLDCLRNILQE